MNSRHLSHRAGTFATELRKGQLLPLAGRRGLRIECREGSLWITQDRDPVDVVLEAGQSHVLDTNERVLIQALATARVAVRPPSGGAGLAAKLQAGWLRLHHSPTPLRTAH